jgi:hypothetical protein
VRKRLLVGLGVSAAVLWLASAALYWWGVGASAADLGPGLAVAPILLAQQARELLAPEAPFAGLPESAALAELRRAFGQGVRPADGRLLHDLIVSRGIGESWTSARARDTPRSGSASPPAEPVAMS